MTTKNYYKGENMSDEIIIKRLAKKVSIHSNWWHRFSDIFALMAYCADKDCRQIAKKNEDVAKAHQQSSIITDNFLINLDNLLKSYRDDIIKSQSFVKLSDHSDDIMH